MEDELDDIQETVNSLHVCDGCQTKHTCQRCIKTTHICVKCGKMFHECDICGSTCKSLKDIRSHQSTSKICRKAKTLTPVSLS